MSFIPDEQYYEAHNLTFPYYRKFNLKKSAKVRYCKNCKDTSFWILEDPKICCRCGKEYQ